MPLAIRRQPDHLHAERAGYRLSLVGGFGLRRARVPILVGHSAERLIAYLALAEMPERRYRVAGALWPDVSDGRAMGNLRSLLWHLRRKGIDVVADDRTWLWLQKTAVDVRTLRGLVADVLNAELPAETRASEDVALLIRGDDLLPGWSEEWLEPTREHFRQVRLHALEALCAAFAGAGQFGRAVEVCLAAVAVEPLRDTSQRELIRLYLAEGNRVEALRQFEAYRSLMADELGLGPLPEIATMVEQIRSR
jgi:DNA-binding SARP family transcriptional activator